MPRPATPIEELTGLLPDVTVKEVYMPVERLFITGGMTAAVALVAVLMCLYAVHAYLTSVNKETRRHLLVIILLSAVCAVFAGISAYAMLYTGRHVPMPTQCV